MWRKYVGVFLLFKEYVVTLCSVLPCWWLCHCRITSEKFNYSKIYYYETVYKVYVDTTPTYGYVARSVVR